MQEFFVSSSISFLLVFIPYPFLPTSSLSNIVVSLAKCRSRAAFPHRSLHFQSFIWVLPSFPAASQIYTLFRFLSNFCATVFRFDDFCIYFEWWLDHTLNSHLPGLSLCMWLYIPSDNTILRTPTIISYQFIIFSWKILYLPISLRLPFQTSIVSTRDYSEFPLHRILLKTNTHKKVVFDCHLMMKLLNLHIINQRKEVQNHLRRQNDSQAPKALSILMMTLE